MKKLRLIPILLALTLTSCLAPKEPDNPKPSGDDEQTEPSGQDEQPEAKNYTVTFNSNGGSSITSQTVEEGKTASKPADPSRDGYTFDGWYLGENEYNFSTPINGNITLIAHWTLIPAINNYLVTFNSNGGSSITSQTIEEGKTASKPADPSRDGYTFDGWYLGENEYNFSSPINGNITLVAHWEEVVPKDYIGKIKLNVNSDFTTYENKTFVNDKISNVTIKSVLDGDTIHVYEGSETLKIRLAYLDCPETSEEYGVEATNYTKSILQEAKTIVVTNALLSSTGEVTKDSTGERYLGLVWYSNKENASIDKLRCLNLEIALEGFAYVHNGAVDPLHGYFLYCLESAQVAKKNIWTNYESPVTDYGYNHYNGYYGELTWENSEDLINKLHTIISKDVKYLRYDSSSSVPTNWETNIYADHVYDDLEMLDVVYSKDDVAITATNTGWQREHAFVASLMTGMATGEAVGAKQGRAVDFHNLFAASKTGNTSRSDKNYGMAQDPTATGYQNIEGCYSSTNKLFEPSEEDKGRLARAIFYMTVMYNTDEEEDITTKLNYNEADKEECGQQSKSVHIQMAYKPLTIKDGLCENSLVNFTKYHYAETDEIAQLVNKYGPEESGFASYVRDNAQFAIGQGATLLEWTTRPVGYQEYQHNQSVYSHIHTGYNYAQGNRNPFVDYPELIDYAFGAKKDSPGDLKNLVPTSYNLGLEDSGIHHYAIKTATREFEVGDTFDKYCYDLVGMDKDFNEVAVNDSVDTTSTYTFTESDIGTKVLQITTDKNTINLEVTVKEKSNSYSYDYLFDSKADFGSDAFTANETREVTLNGKKWDAIATNAVALANKNTPFKAIQIGAGTSGKNADKFTLLSKDSFTNVNRIKLALNAAANKTYSVKVTIGETVAANFTYTGDSTQIILKEIELSSNLSGVVKIEFTNVSAALYIGEIAINEVN